MGLIGIIWREIEQVVLHFLRVHEEFPGLVLVRLVQLHLRLYELQTQHAAACAIVTRAQCAQVCKWHRSADGDS